MIGLSLPRASAACRVGGGEGHDEIGALGDGGVDQRRQGRHVALGDPLADHKIPTIDPTGVAEAVTDTSLGILDVLYLDVLEQVDLEPPPRRGPRSRRP